MRIPLIPLLHTLSLAFAAGIGFTIYAQTQGEDYRIVQKRIAKKMAILRVEGERQTPSTRRYDLEPLRGFFATVNLIGKVAGPPVVGPSVGTPSVDEAGAVTLGDIIRVVCIMRAGDITGAIVEYLDPDVQVPAEFVRAPSPSIANSIPRGRRNQVTMPSTAGSKFVPPHHVDLGGRLWPKYDFVHLVGVARNADSITFELRLDRFKDEQGNYERQTIAKQGLVGIQIDREVDVTAGDRRQPVKDDPEWTDLPAPIIHDRQVTIQRDHLRYLDSRGIEDIAVRKFSANGISGVEIHKLSSHARRFGLEWGDIVVSINDVPVKGVASIKRVGQRLHELGVRTFRIQLIRMGREITLRYKL